MSRKSVPKRRGGIPLDELLAAAGALLAALVAHIVLGRPHEGERKAAKGA